MADTLKTTMNQISKTPTKDSGSGEFGGESAAPFGSHKQSKGPNVIPIKTRDGLKGKAGNDLKTPFVDAFRKGTQV